MQVFLVVLCQVQFQVGFHFPNCISACSARISVFLPSVPSLFLTSACVIFFAFEFCWKLLFHPCLLAFFLACRSLGWSSCSSCRAQSQLSWALLRWQMLQSFYGLPVCSLGTLQGVHVSPELGSTELDTVLQIWSHQCFSFQVVITRCLSNACGKEILINTWLIRVREVKFARKKREWKKSVWRVNRGESVG